jgi:hypothetical protein
MSSSTSFDDNIYATIKKPIKEKEPTNLPKNPYFNPMQYHEDYRDIITTFTQVASGKQIFNNGIFNVGNRAVYKVDVSENEIKKIIDQFITMINNKNDSLPITSNVNLGWNNVLYDKSNLVKSGWDKSQEELGLPQSIYPKPIGKGDIRLIDIIEYSKFETKSEVKYIITIVIQKDNTRDQMMAEVVMMKEKQKKEFIIEEIQIAGFLTYDYSGEIEPTSLQPLADIGEKNGITSDVSIMGSLQKRLDHTEQLMSDFTDNLDDETREFEESMPKYRSI